MKQKTRMSVGSAGASDVVSVRTNYCDDGAKITIHGSTYVRDGGRWVKEDDDAR